MPRKSAQVEQWIEEAIEHHAKDEGMEYDLTLAQAEDGQPIYLVYLWFPSPIIGQTMHRGVSINNPVAFNPTIADQMVSDLIEEFRSLRSKMLAEANGGPPSLN